MDLGWKFLVPLGLLWIMAVAVIRQVRNAGLVSPQQFLIGGGVAIAGLVLAMWLLSKRQPPRGGDEPAQAPLSGGGYPVPPLDLEVPEGRHRRTPARTGAQAGESTSGSRGEETSNGHV